VFGEQEWVLGYLATRETFPDIVSRVTDEAGGEDKINWAIPPKSRQKRDWDLSTHQLD